MGVTWFRRRENRFFWNRQANDENIAKLVNANASTHSVKVSMSKGFRFGGAVAREAFVA